MLIKNNMESFVLQNLDKVLDQFPECCRCEQCRNDIVVWALNHLPPKYVNSKMGDVYTRLDSYWGQDDAEIIMTIAKAVEIVSKHPRHKRLGDD